MTKDLFNSKDISEVRKELFNEQQGKCAITKLPITLVNSHVDHRHDSEQLVRGVVNKHANMLLGRIENLEVRFLKHWYPNSLSDFLRECADYLEKPKDTRFRHNNWIKKIITEFNKLKVSEQNNLLTALGQPKGVNVVERRKLLNKAILTRKFSRDTILNLMKGIQ